MIIRLIAVMTHRMPRKVDNHWFLGYATMKWSHTNTLQSKSPIAVEVCQSVGSASSPLFFGWICLMCFVLAVNWAPSQVQKCQKRLHGRTKRVFVSSSRTSTKHR